jgi:pantoate--beta-alanine ligase
MIMAPVNNDSAPDGTYSLDVAHSVAGLRAHVHAWRMDGKTVGFVPTMGALHEGHLSLVRLAKEKADKVVASIFVNPTQFAAHEDLGTYPRQEAEDIDKLKSAGCDFVFLPTVEEMYPEGASTSVKVDGLSDGLCGTSRPHFFGGVATVVAKLLNQCQPDIAIFGEKDYQQLLIIKRMVRDLAIPVEIIGGPLVREADGLAMSSRNAYLSAEERQVAGQLNVIMRAACQEISHGGPIDDAINKARSALHKAGFDNIDYLEVRSGQDLSLLGPTPLSKDDLGNARLFAASMLGKTRLIDNMPISQS